MFHKISLMALLAYLSISFAEPSRWKSEYFRSQRLRAPAAAQWKLIAAPQKPAAQTAYGPPTPAPSYGPPPAPSYGPPPEPAASYGPPPQDNPSFTTEEAEVTTTEVSFTTEENSETLDVPQGQQNERLQDKASVGIYYIYHPNGLLQKVTYSTSDDLRNMEFSARLRYQNVDPIAGPIYTYDPDTFVFQKI